MIPRLYLAVVFWTKGYYLLPLRPVAAGTLGKVVGMICTFDFPS